jgi:hypothetical protein
MWHERLFGTCMRFVEPKDIDYLEPRKDPDDEPRFCEHCGLELLATDDECSYCKTEDELADLINKEGLDDISWGDDLTYGEKI